MARTTAVQNVVMPLDYALAAPADAAQRAVALLERVGLADRLVHVPAKMSGGQQQRVAIARSLINQPDVLLVDEPTGNLDSQTSVEILQMFRQLNASEITVILVTHDPAVATSADRVIRVADGLVVEDAANELLEADAASERELAEHAEQERLSAGGDSTGGLAVQTIPRVQPRQSNQQIVATQTARTDSAKHRPPSQFAALFPASVRTSLAALWRNRMRSALTALGIVIGVSAVIAMVEISQGSRVALLKTMSTMGADNLLVQSGASTSGGINFGTAASAGAQSPRTTPWD